MRFGLATPVVTCHPQHAAAWEHDAGPEEIARIAVAADRLGFHHVTCSEHVAIPASVTPVRGARYYDPLATFGFLAAQTKNLRFVTHVLVLPYHHPLAIAKRYGTLDRLSGGRLILGVAAGWYAREFDAVGVPFKQRGRLFERNLEILTRLWTEDRVTLQADEFNLREAVMRPKTVQHPRPPILIGGGGEQVTLRLVARYAEASNIFGGPSDIRKKYAILARHCQAVGRDPATVLKTRLGQMLIARNETELTRKLARYYPGGLGDDPGWRVIAGTPDQCIERCQALLDAGVEYPIFSFPDAETLEPLHLFAEEVVPALEG